jgi:acyl-coenzyme A synthetase/AMP-(fatty) acid ligase
MQTSEPTLQAPEFFNFATDVIDQWAKKRPDAPALWWVDAGTRAEHKYTFREIAALSCQAANFLRASGVKRGDRVLVMLPRLPQWWISMLGLIRLGAVPVPATLLLSPREVHYRIETAQVSAVITSGDGVAKVGDFSGISLIVESAAVGWIDFDGGIRTASRYDSAAAAPANAIHDAGHSGGFRRIDSGAPARKED